MCPQQKVQIQQQSSSRSWRPLGFTVNIRNQALHQLHTLEKLSSFHACIIYGFLVVLLWFLTKYHVWKKYSFSTHGFCTNPLMVSKLSKCGNYAYTTLGFIMVIGIPKKGNRNVQDYLSHYGK